MRGPKRLGLGIRGADRGGVDLGDEPPLMIAETPEDHPAMRSVSLRWLTGTVLTGFISIFLMGGALMAALNNPNQFASLAEAAVPDDGPSADVRLDLSQKSDRIQPVRRGDFQPADSSGQHRHQAGRARLHQAQTLRQDHRLSFDRRHDPRLRRSRLRRHPHLHRYLDRRSQGRRGLDHSPLTTRSTAPTSTATCP